LAGKDVLLIDADDQETASDFTILRNSVRALKEGAGYTSVKLHGGTVRTEGLRLASKYDHVIVDVGGRDSAGQRAALSIADIYAIPFLPASFDIWTLDKVAKLIDEVKPFNPDLKTVCFLNRADAKGTDNIDAVAIAQEIPGLRYLDAPLGNRKAFRSAASQGLSAIELKNEDSKASGEIRFLLDRLNEIGMISKRIPVAV
jgi:chromosome partitioning protein